MATPEELAKPGCASAAGISGGGLHLFPDRWREREPRLADPEGHAPPGRRPAPSTRISRKGFIRAEIISFADFVGAGGETQAKRAGKQRLETKQYVMQDYDLTNFRFNK